MTRYIVLPQRIHGLPTLSRAARRVKTEARQAYCDEVADLFREHRGQRELNRWLRDMKTQVSDPTPKAATSVGARILDMTSANARMLRQEVPDIAVIRDRPLSLIGPVSSGDVMTADQLDEAALWHLTAIRVREARDAGRLGNGEGSTVAVLDSGVDGTHPEIASRVAHAYSSDPETLAIDTIPVATDTDGHGTHVAGLVAGATVGVAPAATLISGEMLPGGQGALSEFVTWMNWASTQPDIHIVNISAGLAGFVPELREPVSALMAVGILPVIAAGNEGRDSSRSPGNFHDVLTVGASTESGRVVGFSSSATMVVDHQSYAVPDLVAPGRKVVSAVCGGYEAWNGTSMAAPIVAGVAALHLERYPMIEVLDLIEAILETCTPLSVSALRQGAGLVQC